MRACRSGVKAGMKAGCGQAEWDSLGVEHAERVWLSVGNDPSTPIPRAAILSTWGIHRVEGQVEWGWERRTDG